MNILIIQASFPRSASTLLVNALYGMIPSLRDTKVKWHDFKRSGSVTTAAPIQVLKCHDTALDEIYNKYKDHYRVFFVCSERRDAGHTFEDKYRRRPNIAIFDYRELNETPTKSLSSIISHIYANIYYVLKGVHLERDGGLVRVQAMNTLYEQIKDLPFDYSDDFYQLHGSHRNRNSALRGGSRFN